MYDEGKNILLYLLKKLHLNSFFCFVYFFLNFCFSIFKPFWIFFI